MASCSPIISSRGHTMEGDDYKQIVIGQTRTEDVAAILGSPSTRSNFGDETWYYVSEKIEAVGMLAPEVTEQKVVAIHFDANHVVTGMDNYGDDDAKPVNFVNKSTPTEGHKMTVMEQLFGNFGRFSTPGRSVNPRDMPGGI